MVSPVRIRVPPLSFSRVYRKNAEGPKKHSDLKEEGDPTLRRLFEPELHDADRTGSVAIEAAIP